MRKCENFRIIFMKVAQVQFTAWDKVYNFDFNNLSLNVGDFVIVKTDLGVESGRIVGFTEMNEALEKPEEPAAPEGEAENGAPLTAAGETAAPESAIRPEAREIKPILRKATATDIEKISNPKEKTEAMEYCKNFIDKHKLEMKLVDVHFSFDKSKITFAFIADGRIDFRELVKDLTRHFNRSIRLHQIGIRDEAKLMGDYGHCGRELCCKRFLFDLASITSEMAERQQVVHRGSERISGICGRLMCCLAYEEDGYGALADRLPPLGTKVNVDGKRGVVVGHHILKQSVDVQYSGENGENGVVVEVDLNRNKK